MSRPPTPAQQQASNFYKYDDVDDEDEDEDEDDDNRATTEQPAFTMRIVTMDFYMDVADSVPAQMRLNRRRRRRRYQHKSSQDSNISSTSRYSQSQASESQASQSQPSESQGSASSQSTQPTYKVPVFRLFGITPLGQKVCMHMHGVRPYLFARPSEDRPWSNPLPTRRELRSQIESKLADRMARGSSMQHNKRYRSGYHVRRLDRLTWHSGIPFYGYHHREALVLRSELFNPQHMRKLQETLVEDFSFDVYESNNPFYMQFLMDNRLYPMSFCI